MLLKKYINAKTSNRNTTRRAQTNNSVTAELPAYLTIYFSAKDS